MTPAELSTLKQSRGKRVQMRCTDGELIMAEIIFVSDHERDVIYDLVETNRPERYSELPRGAALSIPFDEIEAISMTE